MTEIERPITTQEHHLLLIEIRDLNRENERWLAWSGGAYPDDTGGDVIAAGVDGTITLDDGITTWNPLRALAYQADQMSKLKEHLPEVFQRGRRAERQDQDKVRAALTELVRLKDGPRDEAYRQSKKAAWAAAREAIK